LKALTGYSIGQYAVQGFFFLSGILVTQSLVSRGDLADYARARALRIFPALIVCVLLTAFVAGPLFTFFGLQGYFLSTGVPNYVFETLSLKTGSAMLPGVFALNPVGGAVNQSLWTLKYEVACYLVLGGLAALTWRLKVKPPVIGIGVALWAAMILMLRPSLVHTGSFPELLSYFSLFFGTGVVAYLMRTHVRIAWQPLLVLAALFVLAWGTDMAEITSALFLGYGLLWLATLHFGALRAFANSNDYSYGVYIYSFPVTQGVLQLWPNANVVSLLAVTIAVTLVLAFLSWELIERPALWLARSWRRGVVAKTEAKVPKVHEATKVVEQPATDASLEAAGSAYQAPQQDGIDAPPSVAAAAKARPLIRRRPIGDSTQAPMAAPVADRNLLHARMAKIAARGQPGQA
jgi:peptidoglycan/LPS O-acetylase OafA/YrhL